MSCVIVFRDTTHTRSLSTIISTGCCVVLRTVYLARRTLVHTERLRHTTFKTPTTHHHNRPKRSCNTTPLYYRTRGRSSRSSRSSSSSQLTHKGEIYSTKGLPTEEELRAKTTDFPTKRRPGILVTGSEPRLPSKPDLVPE